MNIKKIVITSIAGLMLGGAPLVSVANVSASGVTTTHTTDTIQGADKFTQPEARGMKKKAIVWALKNSSGITKIFSPLLSKQNMKYLNKHAWEIGDKLDKLDKYGQDKLASFLMTLGIPSTASRTIAFIVFFVAF